MPRPPDACPICFNNALTLHEVISVSDQLPETDAQWRQRLSPDQYGVCSEKGTEPAFTGAYWGEKTPGVYRCAGCGEVLFDSSTKYDSGSGWPSFWQPADPAAVATETD